MRRFVFSGIRRSSALLGVALGLVLWPTGSGAQMRGGSTIPRWSRVDSIANLPGDSCGRITILKIGNPRAKTVLVFLPGFGAGANLLRPLGEALARDAANLEVWLPERREQNLAPTDYPAGQSQCTPATVGDAPRDWGLAVTLKDLRRVVLAASDRGRRKVVLGGHSWGATEALLYAAWDFEGRAGHRDLAGLLLLDGGVHDSFAGEGLTYRVTAIDAERRLAGLKVGDPFDATLSQLVGLATPGAAATLYLAAARAAVRNPDAVSAFARRLPAAVAPPAAVTNRALLGWLFDAGAPVPDVKLHLGRLGVTGEVRDWIADDPAQMESFARAAAGKQPFGWEWYWPKRLSLDLEAADAFIDPPAASVLGLRLRHARSIDAPLYVFQTGLTRGTVFKAAGWVASQSRIPSVRYAQDAEMSHLDPLFAPAARNRFLLTATAFLDGLLGEGRDHVSH